MQNADDEGGKIAMTADAPDIVYVCLIGASKANDDGWIGVYKSSNKGDSWINPSRQMVDPMGLLTLVMSGMLLLIRMAIIKVIII